MAVLSACLFVGDESGRERKLLRSMSDFLFTMVFAPQREDNLSLCAMYIAGVARRLSATIG